MKAFRWVGWLEGASFLLLLGVAMPLKYIYGYPQAVSKVGMAHGLLFVAYVVMAINVASDLQWPRKRVLLALLASLLPFGTFWFDRKYLSHPAPQES